MGPALSLLLLPWTVLAQPTGSSGSGLLLHPLPGEPATLSSILTGCPVHEIFSPGDDGYHRFDVSPQRFPLFPEPRWDLSGGSGLYFTLGDTSASAPDDGMGITFCGVPTNLYCFQFSTDDSTEAVVMTTQFGRPRSDYCYWYYARFSLLTPDGGNFVAGLYGSAKPTMPNGGTPWEPGTFNGTLSDSITGILFKIRSGQGAPLDSLEVVAVKGRTVRTHRVGLTTPLESSSTGDNLELAFRLEGTDLLVYCVNEDTGTFDIEGVFNGDETEPWCWAFSHQDAGAPANVVFSRLGFFAYGPARPES